MLAGLEREGFEEFLLGRAPSFRRGRAAAEAALEAGNADELLDD